MRTQQDLDGRCALGTGVVTSWARYKAVSVRGRVIVGQQEDVDAVRRRIHERLHQTVSPLPTAKNPTGWQFGEPLRASNVYRMLEQAEPGVRYVDEVRFVVEEAPDERVRTVAADQFQRDTWYAGGGEVLSEGGRSVRRLEIVDDERRTEDLQEGAERGDGAEDANGRHPVRGTSAADAASAAVP